MAHLKNIFTNWFQFHRLLCRQDSCLKSQVCPGKRPQLDQVDHRPHRSHCQLQTAQIIGWFLGYFKKHFSILWKNWFWYIFATFWVNGLLFSLTSGHTDSKNFGIGRVGGLIWTEIVIKLHFCRLHKVKKLQSFDL